MKGPVIEVYEGIGLRTIRLPDSRPLHDSLYEAYDIWEENDGKWRVRVIRELMPGCMSCVCHFPPRDEKEI